MGGFTIAAVGCAPRKRTSIEQSESPKIDQGLSALALAGCMSPTGEATTHGVVLIVVAVDTPVPANADSTAKSSA